MAQKYKTLVMYDAEKKKNIGKTITKANFKSEEELAEHIKKLQEEQREKNKKFTESKNEIHKTIVTNIQHLNNIDNFILDKNTGNTCCILGSSKRGKSTLMMHLYNKFYEPDKDYISTLFSGNHHIDVYKHTKNLLIGSGFNPLSEKYIKLQKYINSKTKNKYKFLNMFDDILELKYKNLINNLVLTYRNANISTIICLQYSKLLSKMNRSNVNNIIIFGSNSDEAKFDVIELYLKQFLINQGMKSYVERLNYYDKVTSDYGFFYINNITSSISTHRLNK